MRIFPLFAAAMLIASCGDGSERPLNSLGAAVEATNQNQLGAANPTQTTTTGAENNLPATSTNITVNPGTTSTSVTEQYAALIAAQAANAEAEEIDENASTDNGQVSLPTSSEQTQALSDVTINGSASILNGLTVNDTVTVSVRGTTASSVIDSEGNFSVTIPQLDTDQDLALDFSGDTVMGKSIPVFVPADATSMDLSVSLARRSAPIAFSLEEGGELANEGEGTSITIPPQAFVLSDGTDAVGEAQVSITEADISDLYGEGSYAPALLGIGEGTTEAAPIITYGMAEFHFTQQGEELQLRDGVTATIEMNLADNLPVIQLEGQQPFTAEAGTVIPMWHFDEEDMVWKQEGAGATVFNDPDSPSGLSAAGEVSHFSWWNLDQLTPTMNAQVNVILVDADTYAPTGDTVTSFYTVARIPQTDIPGVHGESGWTNSRTLTPSSNSIQVLGNASDRETYSWYGTGDDRFTKMEVSVSQIKSPQHPGVNFGLHSQIAIFKNYEGTNTVTFNVPIDGSSPPDEPDPVEPDPDPTPVPVDATVNIIFINETTDEPIESMQAETYQVQATSTEMNESEAMTPSNNTISVAGNVSEATAAELVSTQVVVSNIVAEGFPNNEFDTFTVNRIFMEGDDNVVNIEVLFAPE